MLTETSIIIPKHDNKLERTDVAKSIFHTFVKYVSTHFGGCSVVEGKGYYLMQTGNLVADEWWKVSIVSDMQHEVDACINAVINTICKQLDQESVMVTYVNISVMFAAEQKTSDAKDIYAIV